MGIEDKLKSNQPAAWWQPAVILFVRFSAWIALPVLAGAFLGKWLDRKYDSEPWLFLTCVGLSFFISMFGLIKNVVREYKRIEKEEREKKNQEEKGA